MTERGTTVVCPRCHVPFTRYGPTSSGFYVAREESDVCVICRFNLPAEEWLPPGIELSTVEAAPGAVPPSDSAASRDGRAHPF